MGFFSRYSNCTNGTKSRKASPINLKVMHPIEKCFLKVEDLFLFCYSFIFRENWTLYYHGNCTIKRMKRYSSLYLFLWYHHLLQQKNPKIFKRKIREVVLKAMGNLKQTTTNTISKRQSKNKSTYLGKNYLFLFYKTYLWTILKFSFFPTENRDHSFGA